MINAAKPKFQGDAFANWRKRLRPFVASPVYNFVKGREAEGTLHLGPKHGIYGLTACRTAARWGAVAYWRCPYASKSTFRWPINLSPALDEIARHRRSFAHFRIRNIEDAVSFLAYSPFYRNNVVCLPIVYDQWKNAPGGHIETPQHFERNNHVRHAVTLVGYDIPKQLFAFSNNWGDSWGDGGIGYLPFEYFERYLDEAWLIMPGDRAPSPMEEFDFFLRSECFSNPFGRPGIMIDIWNASAKQRVGWTIATVIDGFLDIEDFYIIPELQFDEMVKLLALDIFDIAKENALKVRYWVPHCDCYGKSENHATANILTSIFKAKVSRSEARWATYKCILRC